MGRRTPSIRSAIVAIAGALALACSSVEDPIPYALAGIQPNGGTYVGGTRVLLTGFGFVQGATVLFDDLEALDVVMEDENHISCTTPAHAQGWADVTVRNPDWTTITVPKGYRFQDVAPEIVADHDRVVKVGTVVRLDATLTTDPDSPILSYAWTLDVPAQPPSQAALTGAGGATPWFVPDVPGSYLASLTVGDGQSTSGPVTVLVTTSATASLVPDGGADACHGGAGGRVRCPSVGEAGFGQDASYLLVPPDLAVVGDTVEDRVTSLTWQRISQGQLNWFEASGTPQADYNPAAKDACGSLVLGGFGDWRLPSVRELATLLRFGAGGTHADLAAFPDGAGAYWTASQDSADLFDVPYAVDLDAGVLTRGAGNRSTPLGVRCVRGAAWGVNALADQGDGTVVDAGTGLEWQASPLADARTWTEALAYCEGLSLGRVDPANAESALHQDWRLPSASEAMTIVFPQGCQGAFPDAQPAHYWTSTPEGDSAFALDCARVGFTDTQLQSTSQLARCVR